MEKNEATCQNLTSGTRGHMEEGYMGSAPTTANVSIFSSVWIEGG